MNAILGFSQLLEYESLPPHQLAYVQEIHRAGDYLLELINELLDLARIESGKMVAVSQPVNLAAAINAATEITQPLMNAKQIHLINQCPTGESVLADPTRLRQILVNLLSNAAKYNLSGGYINISCHDQNNGFLRLCVTDTGLGIPLEKQAYLFKPFERLGAEFTEVEGTGIGLALSKQLTELMGGQVGLTVRSAKARRSGLNCRLQQKPQTLKSRYHKIKRLSPANRNKRCCISKTMPQTCVWLKPCSGNNRI